jgi:fido (protein-threonine AMPylation protein)
MADWDEDSDRLRQNLARVEEQTRLAAERRDKLTVETARQWHRDIMDGLTVPLQDYVGKFRGENGIEDVHVWVGASEGAYPTQVADNLKIFEETLQRALVALDELYPIHDDLNADGLAAVVALAAWIHSEWIRIHPFANGNGRTARIWANAIFMRYGLPPVVRLRPRPDGGYGSAAARAMWGDIRPTEALFHRLLNAVQTDL